VRVLVIDNYIGTPLGLVAGALAEAGADVDSRAAWRGMPVPDSHGDYDGLVVLGGEQSAVDDAGSPWLPQVASLARAFGEADKAVLGICLGAQLVARGHGGQNILGRPLEFGWHYVRPTPAGRSDPVLGALGAGAPQFHWHFDTVTLPPHATRLAESDLTEVQAFRIGRAVYGIQFHFEAARAVVDRWSEDFADVIARHVPGWQQRRSAEAALHGEKADAAGAAIARAWVGLVR
jgi:GMP synthase-like glutamine amidotransferase